MALGRGAASDGNQVGFLLARELGVVAGAGAFAEGAFQTLFHEALAHSPDGGAARLQRLGHLLIAAAFVGQEQHPGASQLAG